MKTVRIPDPEGNGYYNLSFGEEYEYANPTMKFMEMHVNHELHLSQSIYLLKKDQLVFPDGTRMPESDVTKYLMKWAFESWKEQYERIKAISLPEALTVLLESSKKKVQEKAWKGITLKSDEYIALIMMAGEKYGYTLSQYISEHEPKGVSKTEMPRFAFKKEDGKIISTGNTTLTNGQIKSVIDQRSVIISKFLDRGDTWHCFILTYKSISGEEVGHSPHIHYISSAWGLTRDEVVKQVKSKNYKLPPMPHIPFVRSSDIED